MNKALGGCLVAAVVLAVAVGAGLWFFVLKPAAQVADRAIDGAREGISGVVDLTRAVASMRELEAGVRTTDFAAPADGRLASTQVERFLAVQSAVVAALGPAALSDAALPTDAVGAVAEAAGALRALAGLGETGLAAKQAQVDALNAQGMSLDEYRWIRERGTAALVAGGVSIAVAGAGTVGGEALGRAAQTAQRLGEAAKQASEATTAAAEAARRAAEAAQQAWRGTPAPAEPTAPAAPDPAPAEPDTVPPNAVPGTPVPSPAPASTGDPQQANFALVEPHVEAFVRAQALAALGL
jgi:hypothetical protein